MNEKAQRTKKQTGKEAHPTHKNTQTKQPRLVSAVRFSLQHCLGERSIHRNTKSALDQPQIQTNSNSHTHSVCTASAIPRGKHQSVKNDGFINIIINNNEYNDTGATSRVVQHAMAVGPTGRMGQTPQETTIDRLAPTACRDIVDVCHQPQGTRRPD